MLVKLSIWNEVGTNWQLDATFRNNLTGAIFGGWDISHRLFNRNLFDLAQLIGLMKQILHLVLMNVV